MEGLSHRNRTPCTCRQPRGQQPWHRFREIGGTRKKGGGNEPGSLSSLSHTLPRTSAFVTCIKSQKDDTLYMKAPNCQYRLKFPDCTGMDRSKIQCGAVRRSEACPSGCGRGTGGRRSGSHRGSAAPWGRRAPAGGDGMEMGHLAQKKREEPKTLTLQPYCWKNGMPGFGSLCELIGCSTAHTYVPQTSKA